MDEHLTDQLQEAVAQESQAVIRCLVAAERAVEDGRFNIAKVMRAAAHTARIRAMHLQRLLTAQGSPVAPVEVEQQRRHAQRTAFAEANRADMTTRMTVGPSARPSAIGNFLPRRVL